MADAGAIVGPLMHGILTLVMVVGRGFLLAMWAGHERLHVLPAWALTCPLHHTAPSMGAAMGTSSMTTTISSALGGAQAGAAAES
jgi:hypothetical protein